MAQYDKDEEWGEEVYEMQMVVVVLIYWKATYYDVLYHDSNTGFISNINLLDLEKYVTLFHKTA